MKGIFKIIPIQGSCKFVKPMDPQGSTKWFQRQKISSQNGNILAYVEFFWEAFL